MPSALLLAIIAISYSVAVAPEASAAPATAISAGFRHTCALTNSGGVKCWGSNEYGELGNGTTTPSSTPVGVSGLSSKVVAVSTGAHESCALTTSGAVRCWGMNGSGKLGNGTTTDSAVPVAVSGLSSGVRAISVGYGHVCALMAQGTVKCWGNNTHGSLGIGTTISSAVPATVPNLSGVVAISSGAVHSCALTGGGVKCWGYNAYGQVGNATSGNDVLQPEDVTDLTSGVDAISSGGYHSCALTAAGGATCWGKNGNGELGDGTTTDSATPVAVMNLTGGVTSLSGGAYHTCAVTTSGAARCWGANSTGQLGNGTTTDSAAPVSVTGLSSGVATISGGRAHTCTVSPSGQAHCWGWNLDGQVGNGTTSGSVPVPTGVSGYSK